MKKNIHILLPIIVMMLISVSACSEEIIADNTDIVQEVTEYGEEPIETTEPVETTEPAETEISDIDGLYELPAYEGQPYVEINGNIPDFSDEDKMITDAFESYSELDELGRCGVTYANICQEIQPIEERGEIGQVRPSGWHTVKYNDIIDGNYLYNRCHLIGYQLSGENANVNNLITGTRYLNVTGMLPFENMVDDYVDATGNHVLYRVTPVFEGDELLARGVHMEAWSVEDSGAGVCFNVYCFNVQPGIEIDYLTGESREADNNGNGDSSETTDDTNDIEE